jgi:hypothetical protein
MKKFAVSLTVIFVSVGSAQARMSSSRSFAHFPTCTDGLVKQICVCRSLGNPLGPPINFVGLDGIATPSMARADSNSDQRRWGTKDRGQRGEAARAVAHREVTKDKGHQDF